MKCEKCGIEIDEDMIFQICESCFEKFMKKIDDEWKILKEEIGNVNDDNRND